MEVCPVVKAIREIKGAGLTKSSAESVIILHKIGGNGAEDEKHVCNEVAFYIVKKKIEFARFELSRPTIEQCHTMIESFPKLIADAYFEIIDSTLKDRHMYTQFISVINFLGKVEEAVAEKVLQCRVEKKALNISVPDINFANIDESIIYDPDILTKVTNDIVKFANKMNINSILDEKIATKKIDPLPPFQSARGPIDMREQIIQLRNNPQDSKEILQDMSRAIDKIISVAEYVREIEKYHILAIKKINEVMEKFDVLIKN